MSQLLHLHHCSYRPAQDVLARMPAINKVNDHHFSKQAEQEHHNMTLENASAEGEKMLSSQIVKVNLQ